MNNKYLSIGAVLLAVLALALGGYAVLEVSQRTEGFGSLSLTGGTTNLSDLVLSGDISVGDDSTLTDDVDINGDLDVDGTANLDDLDVDASGEIEIDGGLTDFGGGTYATADADNDVGIAADLEVEGAFNVEGSITDDAGTVTVADDLIVDGAANANQLTVQGYTTQTNSLLVLEQSDGTDVLTVSNSGGLMVEGTSDLDDVDIDLSAELNIDGHMVDIGTGTYDTADGDNDLGVTGDFEVDGTTDLDGVLNLITGTEHIGAMTVITAAVAYTPTSGTVATVGDGEIWFVHYVYAHVTTNFDCTGNDCDVEIGDGEDTDGLLDLDDGELQTSDTEGTGAPAGWQGFMSTDARGAYLANGHGFIYAPSGAAETIDYAVAGTDPAAGDLVVYVVYTRLQ